MDRKPRVVIAGAGFAGVKTAKLLRDKADITLVAPTDRFVYLPLIHELVSEHETPRTVSKKLADIFQTATLVEDRVIAIDGNEAVTASGDRIPFDHFVHAAGAEPNDFGLPRVRDHTFSFYSIRDAILANGHLKAAAASVYGHPLKVVIVGASFTGVEVAGEVRELMRKLDVDCEIELLDAGEDIFPHQSEDFRAAVWAGLKDMDLKVRLGCRISMVNEGVVVMGKGKDKQAVPADVILWCAGARPRTIDGVDSDVGPTMQMHGRTDVWVVGDAANFPRSMGVPRLAQTAEAEAKLLAHNILNPHRMKEYQVDLKGIIVSIGRNRAVADMGGTLMTGTVPWHIKKRLYKTKIALY